MKTICTNIQCKNYGFTRECSKFTVTDTGRPCVPLKDKFANQWKPEDWFDIKNVKRGVLLDSGVGLEILEGDMSINEARERLYAKIANSETVASSVFRDYPLTISKEEDLYESNGGSSDYYKLPTNAVELQDLIESQEMNFSLGNIFKAVWRLGKKRGVDRSYDLRKIIWYAIRELAKIEGQYYKLTECSKESFHC